MILSLLASCAEADVVKKLRGFALACPVLRVNPALMPPAPVLLLVKALSAAFPKCAFDLAVRVNRLHRLCSTRTRHTLLRMHLSLCCVPTLAAIVAVSRSAIWPGSLELSVLLGRQCALSLQVLQIVSLLRM